MHVLAYIFYNKVELEFTPPSAAGSVLVSCAKRRDLYGLLLKFHISIQHSSQLL